MQKPEGRDPVGGAMARAVLLLSGGFDSPVAARMLLDQGVELEAIHASLEPITDAQSVEKAKTLARHLGLRRLWVAKIGETLGRIPADREAHRYYFLLQKRLLYRLADALADELGADWIATGENLAQVSSQTLRNLATLEGAARRPVIRPVLGLDKVEIIDRAKAWGTHDISVGPELCDLLGPDHPSTGAQPEPVEAAERRLGLAENLPTIEQIAL
jgi:thiamine biosynthesis protein ThiI